MIFIAPRYIVIDDKEDHLRAIMNTFQQLGTSCVGLHYNQENDPDANLFRGVRCLFIDLHLIDGQVSTDEKRHFALIANILEENIHENGGPFILIIWTEHPQHANDLHKYLDDNLDKKKPYTHPLTVLSLDKTSFIDVDNGIPTNTEALKNAVNEAITTNPQLAALVNWELDVLKAAGDTLVSLMSLIPLENKNSTSFSPSIDGLLSKLARVAVGPTNIKADSRAALNRALAPILNDRIINQPVEKSVRELWEKAITKHSDSTPPTVNLHNAAQINRMLHIANKDFEAILPTDWGAVVECPFKDNDVDFQNIFGITKNNLFESEFKIKSELIKECKLKLVRIGAACDYAQNNTGPISYLLAAEIPENSTKKGKNTSPAIWKSPLLLLEDAQVPMYLYVHQRFPYTVLENNASNFTPTYRIREQMLMNLISSTSNYASRPGMLSIQIN